MFTGAGSGRGVGGPHYSHVAVIQVDGGGGRQRGPPNRQAQQLGPGQGGNTPEGQGGGPTH